ncbi:MAG: hypothetical protein ACMUIE_03230 [Thermoplasmatota archaeon]
MKRFLGRIDNQGVTNVVSMIMIMAIVVSFLGMVFATYLPAWGKDIEVQTLDEVMNSFMDLKSGFDTLSVGGSPGTAITTKMTLGSQGGPLFGFGRMTGSISLEEEDGLMTVRDSDGFTYGQTRGTIDYDSNNLYVDDQKITLEGGAIIREQGISSVLKGPPNLIVDRDSGTGDIRVYVLLINLEGDTVSYTGTGSYMITTTLLTEESSTYEISAGTDVRITMDTAYFEVWETAVDDMMAQETMTKGVDYTLVEDAGGDMVLTISGVDDLVVRSSFFRVSMT